jgi:hypothetical protein
MVTHQKVADASKKPTQNTDSKTGQTPSRTDSKSFAIRTKGNAAEVDATKTLVVDRRLKQRFK